jgi:murein DD-endopeptidase MepM/ murein hydrolase activator NlpD
LPALLAACIVAVAVTGSVTVTQRLHARSADALGPVKGPTDAGVAANLPGTGGGVTQTLPRQQVVHVAPLARRIVPDLFVSAGHTLSAAQLAAVRQATGATSVLALDAAPVHLEQGTTVAIGVDPSTFRAYAPKGTAEVTALWESVARGEAAVAHTVARALKVPLGGHVQLGTSRSADIRVGAYATTALPGIGVVVDRSVSVRYGLVHDAAALLVLPSGRDPGAAATAAKGAVAGLSAVALQTLLPDAPSVPAGQGGWVFPARGPITQLFGHDGHPGIDIGAPLGSPIYAAAAGYVLYAGPASGFGNEIILQHAGGVQTVYGHMRYLIKRAGPVQAGQVIALVGSEGNSTGPHLHFEVHVHNTLTDPLAWLIAHGVPVARS